VIDPKREDCPYPFKKLAGVGVAFKLAQALIREALADRGRTSNVAVHVEERSLLDLVALGTVSDLVPLVGENRVLVQRGLDVLNKARREGVRALLRVARLRPGDISASSIGYGLGPRLNAAGRLGDALLSYKLLVTGDEQEAERLAGRLNDRNRLRQELTAQAYELAQEMALADGQDAPILFAAHKGFQSGIVGLVAGRLTEAHYRPAVVVEKGEEMCKGSCRSIAEFHITRALDECRDLLVRHGGHQAAAGFTVRTENLDALAERLSDIAWREIGGLLRSEGLAPKIEIDALVPLAAMDWEATKWLQQLEPCGEENPTPVFLSRGVSVVRAQAVGAEGRHLRLSLADGQHPADTKHPADTEHPAESGQARDAIAFSQGHLLEGLGQRVDVVYALEVNEWNGERRLQLNVQDIRPTAS
jgi:single-stranded-DNA-specific exonuclease